VSDRAAQLQAFYHEARIADQLRFYRQRRALFDRTAGQAMALSAVLLGFATAAAALAGTDVGPTWLWTALGTVLPAAVTAVTAYSTLYAFEQQSKIYGDAAKAVQAAARPARDDAAELRSAEQDVIELVRRVEAVFRQEQAQWGQLTAQIEIPDDTRR
jgi:SMODS and SLOG-associating 2TM effector domain 1